MPSPVGHALAGYIAGGSLAPSRPTARLAVTFALVGALPDVDLLVGAHSMYTHSVGATVLVAVLAAAMVRHDRARFALACAAAYASHIVLDWLGDDTSGPIGIMALWPLTSDFYQSDLHLFHAITRRYWLDAFWSHNLRAVARELLLVGPVATLVWWSRRRQDTGHSRRT